MANAPTARPAPIDPLSRLRITARFLALGTHSPTSADIERLGAQPVLTEIDAAADQTTLLAIMRRTAVHLHNRTVQEPQLAGVGSDVPDIYREGGDPE